MAPLKRAGEFIKLITVMRMSSEQLFSREDENIFETVDKKLRRLQFFPP
jgi:hypothetical protein